MWTLIGAGVLVLVGVGIAYTNFQNGMAYRAVVPDVRTASAALTLDATHRVLQVRIVVRGSGGVNADPSATSLRAGVSIGIPAFVSPSDVQRSDRVLTDPVVRMRLAGGWVQQCTAPCELDLDVEACPGVCARTASIEYVAPAGLAPASVTLTAVASADLGTSLPAGTSVQLSTVATMSSTPSGG